MLRTAINDLGRLGDISVVLARHGFDRIADIVRTGATANVTQAEIVPAPRRFVQLLQDLGPTYIKLGQVLSTRPDILPSAYIAELKTLQENVQPLEFAVIAKELETALGKPIGDLFAGVEETPLATASISQVHRATLPDGRRVVLKVQRPGIEKTIRSDIDLLYLLARLLDATIEESALYRPTGIVKEFERAILEELDFVREARNLREFRRNFADNPRVRFPEAFDDLTTRNVLCMEFMEGEKISEVDPHVVDVDKVVRTLLDGLFQMVYVDGLFHGDPHPGNIRVQADGSVALLDYGLVGRLTKGMQDTLGQLSLAVALKDADATTRLVLRLGTPAERVNLLQLRDEIQGLLDKYVGGNLGEVNTGSLLSEMLDLAMRYRVRIQPDFAILAKAGVTIEGMIRTLKPDLDITSTIAPYSRKILLDRFGPRALGELATKQAIGALSMLQDLPLQLNQIVSDLGTGRLTVRVNNDEINRIGKSLNDLGSKMFLGLIACGLILGSCFLLTRVSLEVRGVPIAAIVGLLAAGGIVTIVFWWHFLYGRVRKIRLMFWVNLFRRKKGK